MRQGKLDQKQSLQQNSGTDKISHLRSKGWKMKQADANDLKLAVINEWDFPVEKERKNAICRVTQAEIEKEEPRWKWNQALIDR